MLTTHSVSDDQLRPVLIQRHPAVAAAWYRTIAHTSFAPARAADVQTQIATFALQIITLLLTEPFDPHPAQAIGADFVRFHYLQPVVLEYTHEVLTNELTSGLSAEQTAVIAPRLASVLAAFATGFCTQMQQTILAEQEQIRRALVAEYAQAEAARRSAEERLRMIVTSIPVVLFALDRAGVFMLAEGKGLEHLGYLPHEVLGQSIQSTAQENPQILCNVQRALAGETFMTRVAMKGFVFESHYAPLRGVGGAIHGVIGVAVDITARLRVEADLLASRRHQAKRLTAERQRMARDLHDGVVQHLLWLSYRLSERLQCTVGVAQATASDQLLADVQQEMLAIVAQVRQVISDLRPLWRDDLRLTVALEAYIETLQQVDGPTIELTVKQEDQPLSPDIVHCLFRVAQEALRNALRHAQAQHIRISLEYHADAVTLYIQDDGRGFQLPESWCNFSRAGRVGIIGIHEQVDLVHGAVTIQSLLDSGTTVRVWIPLSID